MTDDPAAEATGFPPVKYELCFTVLLAILVAAIVWQASSLPTFGPDGTVGPGFFPIPLSLALLVGLAFHTVKLWKDLRRTTDRGAGGVFGIAQYFAVALVLLAAVIGSVSGLAIAIMLLLFGGLITIERLPVFESVVFTVVFLILFYFLFDLWLGQNIGLNGLR